MREYVDFWIHVHFFLVGNCGIRGIPEGPVNRTLPSCLEAHEMVVQYIDTEQQAGRLAGPFPLVSSVIRKISPIGLISKQSPGSYHIIHLLFPTGESA